MSFTIDRAGISAQIPPGHARNDRVGCTGGRSGPDAGTGTRLRTTAAAGLRRPRVGTCARPRRAESGPAALALRAEDRRHAPGRGPGRRQQGEVIFGGNLFSPTIKYKIQLTASPIELG